MKLYEISEQMQGIENFLEENPEASKEAIHDTLDGLDILFEDKIEGTIRVMKGYEAEADALKEESKRLADRAKVASNKAAGLESYIDINMRTNNKEELKAGIFNLSYRKNPPSVDVLDLKLLPKAYKKVKTVVNPDKNAIKKAFQDGEEIPGANYIDDKKTLQIK